jgi:hypothetical protein
VTRITLPAPGTTLKAERKKKGGGSLEPAFVLSPIVKTEATDVVNEGLCRRILSEDQ